MKFTNEEENRIVAAIRDAENQTTGEIRVHLAKSLRLPVKSEAEKVFTKLKMHKTEKRNAVLFFIAFEKKQFAVIGDQGINELVPDGFWDHVVLRMKEQFSQGHYADAIVEGVTEAGQKLKTFFPASPDDTNELDNTVSYE
jgi:uncharacterized membrane protein